MIYPSAYVVIAIMWAVSITIYFGIHRTVEPMLFDGVIEAICILSLIPALSLPFIFMLIGYYSLLTGTVQLTWLQPTSCLFMSIATLFVISKTA